MGFYSQLFNKTTIYYSCNKKECTPLLKQIVDSKTKCPDCNVTIMKPNNQPHSKMIIFDVKEQLQALWTHPIYSKQMTYYLNIFETPEGEVHDTLEGEAFTQKIYEIDPQKKFTRNVYFLANEDG